MQKPSACLASAVGGRHADRPQEGQARQWRILSCQMMFTAQDQHELSSLWSSYESDSSPSVWQLKGEGKTWVPACSEALPA